MPISAYPSWERHQNITSHEMLLNVGKYSAGHLSKRVLLLFFFNLCFQCQVNVLTLGPGSNTGPIFPLKIRFSASGRLAGPVVCLPSRDISCLQKVAQLPGSLSL